MSQTTSNPLTKSSERIEETTEEDKSLVPEFKYTSEDFKKTLALFHSRNWPVALLLRDHYGTKLLVDNDVFSLIDFYKHEWKYDKEEDELLILHKKTKHAVPTYVRWSDLYPYINIKKTARGEFMFDGAAYTADGLEYDNTYFQYSSAEFRDMLAKFVKEGWPVQFLLRDHYGSKVMYDNQVFQYIEFYGHSYKWDEDKGLILMACRSNGVEWVAWKDIADEIPIQRTPQGWLLFDGWIYGQDGLVEIHMWQWKTLSTSYIFPKEKRPDSCYVDIITFNWEHDGMPGFGIGIGNPHGHTSVEFGDDLGNFYSVGMYMDPRSPIDTKKAPAATIRACLMSPDPYLPSKGEKTIHRYALGKGKEGRENIAKLKKYIEEVQDWRKNEETGVVKTCPRKYQPFTYNCGDFQEEVEKFAQAKLGAKLDKLDANTVYVPHRKPVAKATSGWISDFFAIVWNTALLWLMDFAIWIVIGNPFLAKKIGSEKQDDFSDFDSQKYVKTHGQSEGRFGFTFFAMNNFKTLTKSLKPHSVKFPRKVRLAQLYSPRLKRHSALLRS